MVRLTVSRFDLDCWVAAQVANLIIDSDGTRHYHVLSLDGDRWYIIVPDGDIGRLERGNE